MDTINKIMKKKKKKETVHERASRLTEIRRKRRAQTKMDEFHKNPGQSIQAGD